MSGRRRWIHGAALLALLGLAAALRFVGLAWGLRHPPNWDEQVFVGGAAAMLRNHDWDPRFYEYPGLFFLILSGPLALLGAFSRVGGPSAYLMSRTVVAAFGVTSVGLTYYLAARVAGVRAGLVAALFLAVSPIDVSSAHMVRPDVVLEAFCLAALLAFGRLGSDMKWDVIGGVLLGAAISVKPTGVFLLPAFALHRWVAPGSRFRGALLAAGTACAVLLLTTPAVFIRPQEIVSGLTLQFRYHYRESSSPATLIAGLVFYARTLAHGFGAVGCALGLAGLWIERSKVGVRSGLLFGLALLTALSGAQTHWVRLLLPAFGVAAMAVGLGGAALGRRSPWLAAGVVLAGALPPLFESVAYARDASRPGTRDEAVDWVQEHVPPGGLGVTSMLGIGFDRMPGMARASGVPERDRLLALAADVIVQPAREAPLVEGARVLARFQAVHDPKVEGPAIVISTAPPELHRTFRGIPLEGAVLRSSSNSGGLKALVDGRLDTYWATETVGPGREWVEVDLPAPVRVGRVELRLGHRPARWGRLVRLSASDDGQAWRALVSTPAGATVDEQRDDGSASQAFLVEPVVTRRLRIDASSAPRKRWGFAELSISEVEVGSARGR